MLPGYLLLEDGARFVGQLCAAQGTALGEVVFTTSMSGYQESATDPSFAGQLLVYTTAQVGNYGASQEAMESDQIHVRGIVMREAVNYEGAPSAERGWLDWLEDCEIPAITGVDTRALVRHLRSKGSLRGGIFTADTPLETARNVIGSEPAMAGQDLVQLVTPDEPSKHGVSSARYRIAAIDTGIKTSIIREFVKRDVYFTLYPSTVTTTELLADNPDGIFIANGPGDPAALDYIVATIRECIQQKPVFGICLGHQLLCRALGLSTYKLPFGHRGANHPVKDLLTGKIEITSQNHGFAVALHNDEKLVDLGAPVQWETDFGSAQLTHVNLYDRTVEGLRMCDLPVMSVQYHPEAGPGPHDSLYLFDRFLELIDAAT